MNSLEYKKYLNSSHWKEVKARYRQSKLIQECYICGSKNKIHLHHKSYKRIGNENLNDLIPLCEKCHSLVHFKLKQSNSQKVNLWNIARKVKRGYLKNIDK